MRRLWLLLSGMVLVALMVLAIGCISFAGTSGELPCSSTAEIGTPLGIICNQQNQGISVSGEGKVNAVPDIAVLSLGIEAEEATVAVAQKEAAITMDKVMKALKESGIAEKDIQTQRFSIYPMRRWIEKENREEIIGYRVTNMVTVKIRQIEKTGDVIDEVTYAGGDLTRIQDIGFTVDDPSPYYKEARKKAVEDAMEKAKQLAELSDVKLGKPLNISEGGIYTPPILRKDVMYAMEGAAPVPSTPISAGELEIQLTVNIVYGIR